MWLRLEESIFEHPRFIGLEHGAHGLFVKILCAAKKRCDGGLLSIHYADPKYWSALTREPLDDIERWLDALFEAGAIERTEDGLSVHNWRKYQTDPTCAERSKRYRNRDTVTDRDAPCRHSSATVAQRDARDATAATLRVEKSRVEKNRIDPPYSPPKGNGAFDAFWEVYPRKMGKKAARNSWDKAKDKPDVALIVAAIERQRQSPQWTKDGGQYIPLPATWLNQGRWDDEETAETGNDLSWLRPKRDVNGNQTNGGTHSGDVLGDLAQPIEDAWSD